MFILLPLLSADFANSDKTRAGFLLGRGKAGVTGTIRRRVSPPLKQVETNAFRPLPPHRLLCATAVEGKHRPSSGSLGSAQAAQPARASRADKTLHAARTRCSVNHLQRGGFLILKKKFFFLHPSATPTKQTNRPKDLARCRFKFCMDLARRVSTRHCAHIKHCLSGENPSFSASLQ